MKITAGPKKGRIWSLSFWFSLAFLHFLHFLLDAVKLTLSFNPSGIEFKAVGLTLVKSEVLWSWIFPYCWMIISSFIVTAWMTEMCVSSWPVLWLEYDVCSTWLMFYALQTLNLCTEGRGLPDPFTGIWASYRMQTDVQMFIYLHWNHVLKLSTLFYANWKKMSWDAWKA